MTPELVASIIAVGAIGILGVGVFSTMRPKRITLVDYPELPAPPKDDGSGPTMQA